MKIGILGGSFDPIHNGHLYMAIQAHKQYSLDEVWLIPNGNAAHKESSKMADAEARLAMCRLAAAEYDFLKVSDIEILSTECSYTYITAQKMKEQYPDDELYFIMGADSLDYFETWKNPQIIASLCRILVVNRDDFSLEDMQKKIDRLNILFPAQIDIVHCPKIDISSTEIRNELDPKFLSPAVYQYIREHGLYKKGEKDV